MNLVALIGNVAAAPELRKTAGDKSVCTFRLAVSRPTGEEADFVTIVAWDRQAEVCAEYLHVGRRVGIEGRLHHSTWEVQEGSVDNLTVSKRSKVEVIAHRVQLIGPRRVDPPETETDTLTDTSAESAQSSQELEAVT